MVRILHEENRDAIESAFHSLPCFPSPLRQSATSPCLALGDDRFVVTTEIAPKASM
jgi:hypothetical protein